MLNRILATLIALFAASNAFGDEVAKPIAAESAQFSVGDIWSYETRPGERASRVLIGRIEALAPGDIVIHIRIDGLKMRSPASPTGYATVVGHAPISEKSLAASVAEKEPGSADVGDLDDGYEIWLEAYLQGKAGVFSGTVAEVVEWVEGTLSPQAR